MKSWRLHHDFTNTVGMILLSRSLITAVNINDFTKPSISSIVSLVAN